MQTGTNRLVGLYQDHARIYLKQVRIAAPAKFITGGVDWDGTADCDYLAMDSAAPEFKVTIAGDILQHEEHDLWA